jgi:hypothetical protein
MRLTDGRIRLFEAFAVLLLLGGAPTQAQRAQQPAAVFFAAPGASDNPTCAQMQPCSPQGAVMACQMQWIYLCGILLADGLYLDPAINIYHYKFIQFQGNLQYPQNVVFRATLSNSTLMTVQDHATMTVTGVRMDSADGVTGVIGIGGRQMIITDYGLVNFGALPGGWHVYIEQFSIATCNQPVRIDGSGSLRVGVDNTSQSRILCPVTP